jgi:hypothetical protein
MYLHDKVQCHDNPTRQKAHSEQERAHSVNTQYTHTRTVKRTCIGPRHQSVAACFRAYKSTHILVKRVRRPDAHTAPLQRMRRKFSAPGCTNMPVMSIVHAFMLTACLEACFWTRKRSPHQREAVQRIQCTVCACEGARSHLRRAFGCSFTFCSRIKKKRPPVQRTPWRAQVVARISAEGRKPRS